MSSLNNVEIMGNLGADPELRHTKAGKPVATLSIATTRKYKRGEGTYAETIEETEWHRVVVWGGAAEVVAKHKRKGDQLLVRGYLRTTKYTDKEGVDRYSTEIVAGEWQRSSIVFTGRASGGGQRPEHPADDPHASEPPTFAPGDDDIPF